MKIFLDTANLESIKMYNDMGLLDGITTNPSLLSKEGGDPQKTMEEICRIIKGDVSLEVVATDYEGMMEMFRGHGRWLTIVCVSLMAVTITVMVISAIQFFRVEGVRAMIAWATGFTVCFILEALIEFWFLAECRKNALQCQFKRLELQVAALASGLERGLDEGPGKI